MELCRVIMGTACKFLGKKVKTWHFTNELANELYSDILFRNAVVAFHGNRGNPSLGVAQKKVVQQQSAMAG